MYYINYKEGKVTVTVNEFKSKEDAEVALAEMDSDKEYYVSNRPTKVWKEAKEAEELVNEEVEAEEEESDEYTTLDNLLEEEAEVNPDEDYEDVDDEDECDCEGDCNCCKEF